MNKYLFAIILLFTVLGSCNTPSTPNITMDENKFWRLIDMSRNQSENKYEVQCEKLELLLESEKPDDIVKFDSLFKTLQDRAYTWELWAAAYIINGGCADDCFTDFRSWLIGQGQKVYKDAINNPDTLTQINIEPDNWEGLQYCALKAYQHNFHKKMPIIKIDTLIDEPAGKKWEDDEESLKRLLPKLYAKWGEQKE